MKKNDMIEKMRNEQFANMFFDLWDRWQCEKDYEDINDYLVPIKDTFPEAFAMTKRPFGFKVKDSAGNKYHICIIRRGNSLVQQMRPLAK